MDRPAGWVADDLPAERVGALVPNHQLRGERIDASDHEECDNDAQRRPEPGRGRHRSV